MRARAAATRAAPEQIALLEQINLRMLDAVRSDDPDRVDRVQQHNNQFHHALIDAAQSARVRALVENLLDMPIIIGSFYFYSREDMLASVEHHRQIIAALRASRSRLRGGRHAIAPGGHAPAVPQPPQDRPASGP